MRFIGCKIEANCLGNLSSLEILKINCKRNIVIVNSQLSCMCKKLKLKI